MASNAFLQISDAPGEALGDHADWIEVLSLNQKISLPASGQAGAKSHLPGGKKGIHEALVIKKPVDKADPKLAVAASSGTNLGTITLELCREVGEKTPYMTVTADNAHVMSWHLGGRTAGDESVPEVEVAFTYSKVTWKYKEFDAEGKAKGDVETSFDVAEGKAG